MSSRVSLAEVHQSVEVPSTGTRTNFFRRLLAFGGPAYLISVGYMDPGNWATDLEGGARFGYALLWILLLSNLMALLLQTLSARLGIVTGRDLAQACRDEYPKPVTIALWVLCEIAIAACDLAEVLGTAIAINLLFGLHLLWGVLITSLDAFVLLGLQRLGMRKLEAAIISLVLLIGCCFIIEIALSSPDWGGAAHGLVPTLPIGSLVIAIGIIGATVMPHNLYLHSALVQTRQFEQSVDGKRQACKYNFLDSLIALNGAFFINAAILILASAVFFSRGQIVTEIQQAHALLSPLLGTVLAGVVFAVALLASGQSSTVTGTLAGQIVMEGFLHLRIRPVVRRIITRLIAIIPAVIVIAALGESSTLPLLIASQVILSLQLSFALIPLIQFTSSRALMGDFANKWWVKLLSWATAAIILGLNAKYIFEFESSILNPSSEFHIYGIFLFPVLIFIGALLVYILVRPFTGSWTRVPGFTVKTSFTTPNETQTSLYDRVGAAVEGNENDERVINEARSLCKQGGTIVIIHIVGSAMTLFHGSQTRDSAARNAETYLSTLGQRLQRDIGHTIKTSLGYGLPPEELVRIAKEEQLDLLVMRSHGHRGLKDIIFGATISPVRHKLSIPIFIVK
ncbi:MAG TPA: Nramp family divalent metal transporter [Candidatus Kapabacteria bacterium]|nr:Nramp family divalent metal transporter [Candidatus Kapabacteria bacterium]